MTLPTDSASRKAVPLASGVLDYFPAALAEVARVSKAGNDKHNPGQPMHHARGKSTDHADSLLRHLMDRGKVDADTGQRHSAEVAWRALAMLQQELEDEGLADLPRGARPPEDDIEVGDEVVVDWAIMDLDDPGPGAHVEEIRASGFIVVRHPSYRGAYAFKPQYVRKVDKYADERAPHNAYTTSEGKSWKRMLDDAAGSD